MGRMKTMWRVRNAQSPRTWEKQPTTRLTRDAKKASLAMKPSATILLRISIVVRLGQVLKPRRVYAIRRTLEYKASAKTCGRCALRLQCTRSTYGRTVQRHEKQELLNIARAQANSAAARRDRARRRHLIERSFADAANNHHFKRARWRRLWRQQIQD